MGFNSAIEWCDHTLNFWIGCQEVSPACDNCYARVQNNFRGWVKGWGPHGERRRTKTWRDAYKWDKAAKAAGVKAKVFSNSLSDFFDNKVDPSWRSQAMNIMVDTPNLIWLVLTKRPENAAEMVPQEWEAGWPDTIWFGITGEDQKNFDRRWEHAKEIPAAVRFVSYGPALGPLRLPRHNKPDWIIFEGESGSNRRPVDLAWARSMRDQCASADVAFFMKQVDKVQRIPADLMIRQFPTTQQTRSMTS